MTYKTILVHVEATAESDQRLAAAAALANAFDATLIGLGGGEPVYRADPVMIAAGGGFAIQECIDQDARALKESQARLLSIAAQHRATAFWRSREGYPARSMEELAAGADLIVASAAPGPKTMCPGAAELMLRAGLPVVVLPPNVAAVGGERVLVSWKNTREARRAIADAMPFLERAQEVRLLSVSTALDPASDSMDEALARLRRHGVEATAQHMDTREVEAGPAILGFAAAHRCDLIVAGGFGRSRAREWLLGGVTQVLLESSPLPVLFSH